MTSLKLQLDKLADAHTQWQLTDSENRKRASFLYDPKVASTLDRETIYCLGNLDRRSLSLVHCARSPRYEWFRRALSARLRLRRVRTRPVQRHESYLRTKHSDQRSERFVELDHPSISHSSLAVLPPQSSAQGTRMACSPVRSSSPRTRYDPFLSLASSSISTTSTT